MNRSRGSEYRGSNLIHEPGIQIVKTEQQSVKKKMDKPVFSKPKRHGLRTYLTLLDSFATLLLRCSPMIKTCKSIFALPWAINDQ